MTEVNHAAMQSTLRTVFMIFAVFWVAVVAILLIAMGPLTRKWRSQSGSHGAGHGGGHA